VVIQRWSQGNAGLNMPESILVEVGPLIRRHPWWQARAALVIRLLRELGLKPPARVIDAGCGWGVTLGALEKHGFRAIGLDVSRRALELLDRPERTLVEADLTQPFARVPLEADAVLALDVIEHLDDDRAAVRHLASLARPGGLLVVSVPALPDLFSEFDTIQGHRRRYLPDSLRAAFGGSELQLERILWWGQGLVPLLARQRARPPSPPGAPAAWVYRRYLKLPPWPSAWLIRALLRLEEGPTVRGRAETGTSLFAVARRRAAGGPGAAER
jgi:SAM-dependent methyltransferase